jgi:hypothetical protein
VGVILKKHVGFAIPIGMRRFDAKPISAQALRDAPRLAPLPQPLSRTGRGEETGSVLDVRREGGE